MITKKVSEDAIRKSAQKIAEECSAVTGSVTAEEIAKALIEAHRLLEIETPDAVVINNNINFVDSKFTVERIPFRASHVRPLRLT